MRELNDFVVELSSIKFHEISSVVLQLLRVHGWKDRATLTGAPHKCEWASSGLVTGMSCDGLAVGSSGLF